MIFPTDTCPLCHKSLQFKKIAGVNVWECGAYITVQDHNFSHYQVEQDTVMTVQHVYILPHCIDTFADSAKSRIYRVGEHQERKWKLLMEVPVIRVEGEVKLRERLHNLLIFI